MHLGMLNVITSCIITLIFSFFAAAIVYKVLHGLLRFRAEWNTTFIACLMTVFTCEVALGTALIAYDHQVPGYLLRVVATTALISMIAGTVSCRLIIRSRSGRHLPLIGASLLTFLLTAPPTVLGVVLHFMVDGA
jgi:hypothetical protein